MKAKSKPLATKSPGDYGVDVARRLETLKVVEPAKRQAGIKVGSVDELVEKAQGNGDCEMSVLVLVEHDGSSIKDATLATVTAASQLGDVNALVVGNDADAAAQAAAKIAGRRQSLCREQRWRLNTSWPRPWRPSPQS